ncbi:hypothetical protein D3C81_645650 [compost metagenome]
MEEVVNLTPRLLKTISDIHLKRTREVLIHMGKIETCRYLMEVTKCNLRDAKDLADHIEQITRRQSL